MRSGSLITSGGGTAGIDLALAFVAEDYGAKNSRRIAQQLVVLAQRQGGQSQYSPYLSAPQDGTLPISRVQAHVLENTGEEYNLGKLAAIAGMSTRSFSRHFTQVTGITPREFIEKARLDSAKLLLEATSQPLKAIASAVLEVRTTCAASHNLTKLWIKLKFSN